MYQQKYTGLKAGEMVREGREYKRWKLLWKAPFMDIMLFAGCNICALKKIDGTSAVRIMNRYTCIIRNECLLRGWGMSVWKFRSIPPECIRGVSRKFTHSRSSFARKKEGSVTSSVYPFLTRPPFQCSSTSAINSDPPREAYFFWIKSPLAHHGPLRKNRVEMYTL